LSQCGARNILNVNFELLRKVCAHETPVVLAAVDRTKAGAINSKQLLHQRLVESKWHPSPEVNGLVAQPVFATINGASLALD